MVNEEIITRLLNNMEGYLHELRSAKDINYEKIESEQVFAIFSNHLDDFEEFLQGIRTWLGHGRT